MPFSPFILAICVGIYGIFFILSWRLIGLYFEDGDRRPSKRAVMALSGIQRIVASEENGFMDRADVFHCHFYRGTVDTGEASRRVVFFRYFPDAFGKPFRNRLRRKSIKWWQTPHMRGFQLSRNRFLVWPAGSGI